MKIQALADRKRTGRFATTANSSRPARVISVVWIAVSGAIAWRWMLESGTGPVPALLVALALVPLASALTVFVEHGFKTTRQHLRAWIAVALSVLLILGALCWGTIQRITPSLAASIARLAGNGWAWFALVLIVCAYFALYSIVILRQRNKVIDSLEKDHIPFRRALEEWVLPRRLTRKQRTAITAYLKQFPPQTFRMLVQQNNDEASRYAGDVRTALTDGGWTIAALQYGDNVPQGLTIHCQYTQATAQRQHSDRDPKAEDLLRNALAQAAIVSNGGQSGSSASITVDSFTVQVGPRPLSSVATTRWWTQEPFWEEK